jgi:hypothetical protein
MYELKYWDGCQWWFEERISEEGIMDWLEKNKYNDWTAQQLYDLLHMIGRLYIAGKDLRIIQ